MLKTQLERIHTLFRRQLAIPLMGKHDVSSGQTGCCKMRQIPVARAICQKLPSLKKMMTLAFRIKLTCQSDECTPH